MTRDELVAALEVERFTHHVRTDPQPNPNTPHPVDNPAQTGDKP